MRNSLVILLLAHIGLALGRNETRRSGEESLSAEYKDVFLNDLTEGKGQVSLTGLVEAILFNVVPILLKQKPFNLDGKFEENKKHLLEDTSNDEIKLASVTSIIERSGYRVEKHKVVAEDGYITTLYHLINPLANRSKLKQPPVMVMHGGIINPTAYLWASAIQHHPEKYPRTAQDGPITSWNRSLAFTLANNGYDVWLAGTRGSNLENQGRVKMLPLTSAMKGENKNKNITLGENVAKLMESFSYWRYSFDDLIQYEVPLQLEKILELTGAQNVSLFTYSYSTIIALPLLGSRPDLAKKVHNLITLAPLLHLEGANTFVRLGCALITSIPVSIGTKIFTRVLFSQLVRNSIAALSESRKFRYTILKFALGILLGSSGKYRTFLELPVVGHLLEPSSFQQIQHSCQIAKAKQYQKYDFGALKNSLIYGQVKPPVYDISNIGVEKWMLIWADNDNFAPIKSTKQIVRQVNPKPSVIRRVSGANHLDLSASFDNDIQVNLPLMKFLDQLVL